MTGRDYKKLVKLHREFSKTNPDNYGGDFVNYKFLTKLIDRKNLVKYEPINYDLYKDFIQDQKSASNSSLLKVKNLQDTSKFKKETSLVKYHALVWFKEWHRLKNQFRHLETELTDYGTLFEANSIDYIDLDSFAGQRTNRIMATDEERDYEELFACNQIDDVENFSALLNDERIKFKVRTVYPINELIDDLKYYNEHLTKTPVNQQQNRQISATINGVKEQQRRLMTQLRRDEKKLNEELDLFSRELNRGDRGIPQEAFELECPNDELKVSVLQEFLIIDYKYEEKLNELNESARTLDAQDEWTTEEHELFQHLYDTYHVHYQSFTNCTFTLRELMFDFMKRVFGQVHAAKIDRNTFVKQEDWSETKRYLQQQEKLIVSEWNGSRRALLLKAEAIFTEAFEMIERERVKREEKEKQQRICDELYVKVSKWRDQKLEALAIQQKIDEIIKKQNAEKRRQEKEKENMKRLRNKQAIADYNQRMEMQKRQLELAEEAKLEKLKTAINEQALKDKERIEYRKELYFKKKEQLNADKINKQTELENREKRLKKFYDSVKPNVPADPTRVVSFTEAELNRRGVHKATNDLYVDQKPMYTNYGFTDKQIGADARLRIEQRLREAGLINSDYAKVVMDSFKSNQVKRDLKSNINWD